MVFDHERFYGEQDEPTLEDIRRTNCFFNKVRVMELVTMLFSITGIGSAIIANELEFYYN